MENVEKYGLDLHCTMLLEDFEDRHPIYESVEKIARGIIQEKITQNGLYINALESRVKNVSSLAGKLELKGSKYAELTDITDLVGLRIITFYNDEVDKVAAMVEKSFSIDWGNSVDKRKMHQLDSFGYNSLHYICRIPKKLYFDEQHPEINDIPFEVQMRTVLQHMWATMHHDTGYKSGVEIPVEYLRNLNRLAGMLELADEQFSLIRTNINDYRRKVQGFVSDGRFDEVPLDGDTFRSYLTLCPFDNLNKKIATINQAEIHQSSCMPYLAALKAFGYKTLGDVENLIKNNSDDAYQLAVFQISETDLDIISSTLAIQNLLIVAILKDGGGTRGLRTLFDYANGESPFNADRANRVYEQAQGLSFMNK